MLLSSLYSLLQRIKKTVDMGLLDFTHDVCTEANEFLAKVGAR